jgi:hypothetical protein
MAMLQFQHKGKVPDPAATSQQHAGAVQIDRCIAAGNSSREQQQGTAAAAAAAAAVAARH